ncbi:hypothetical protein [Hyphomicrobium sp. 802]|uniref:hypothetical protein n=1 Tax=Hyphomicrobium sp. 802 TaxID=1112272 RepID=UPI00045EAF12|nr:hypothetical protein [Hyphomicrobium sp. 802]
MSKGKQLWPGDEMLNFFRAHIRRETSLDAETAEKLAAALTKSVNRMLVWEVPAELPEAAATPPPPPKIESEIAVQERHDRAENFNPYLFSALVALAKHGRDGLMLRLKDIKSAENLRAFAEAQHVPVDASLKRTDDIRKAIVAGVERRLADRKAAAS